MTLNYRLSEKRLSYEDITHEKVTESVNASCLSVLQYRLEGRI